MFELWVPITLAAVVFQTARTALQKHLTAELTTSGVTFVRFLFGTPLALIYLGVLLLVTGAPVPEPNGRFILFAVLGGAGQIIGNFLLIRLFAHRNFAVGTTYSKTEAVQTALFGLVFFGEALSLAGFGAIVVSVFGVMMISVTHDRASLRGFLGGWTSRVALIGLASGAGFAVAAVAIRAASLSLGAEGFMAPAAYTLVWVTALQFVIMGAYMLYREAGQFRKIFRNFRYSFLVGLSGVLGSVAWFNAMTLENAAYVRTVGQIELVLSLLTSYLIFKERSSRYEIIGMVLIVIGIVILLRYR